MLTRQSRLVLSALLLFCQGCQISSPLPVQVLERNVAPAVSVAPQSPLQLLLKDGQLAAAEALLLTELANSPAAVSTRSNLAILYARSDRVDDAQQILVKVVTEQPGYCPAELQLAAIYLQQFKVPEAERAYLACLQQNPVHPAALLNLGILYELYQGQLSEALSLYERYQAVVSKSEVPVERWIADLSRRLEASTINNQLAEARP